MVDLIYPDVYIDTSELYNSYDLKLIEMLLLPNTNKLKSEPLKGEAIEVIFANYLWYVIRYYVAENVSKYPELKKVKGFRHGLLLRETKRLGLLAAKIVSDWAVVSYP